MAKSKPCFAQPFGVGQAGVFCDSEGKFLIRSQTKILRVDFLGRAQSRPHSLLTSKVMAGDVCRFPIICLQVSNHPQCKSSFFFEFCWTNLSIRERRRVRNGAHAGVFISEGFFSANEL